MYQNRQHNLYYGVSEMPKACDLKKGDVVIVKGSLCIVKGIDVNNPTSRGASTLYKVRFAQVPGGQKLEQRFKGDDMLESAQLERRSVGFSYTEGDTTTFMDTEDFTQYTLSNSDIEAELLFITEGIEGMIVLLVDGDVIGIELPQSVVMTVQETSPVIKGASASARTKPAEFSTGLVIQVPEYLAEGEKVKINTVDKSFMQRA